MIGHMTKFNVEVDADFARDLLALIESGITEKQCQRDSITAEIEVLQARAKSLRDQMQRAEVVPARAPQGDNRERIRAYLAKLPEGQGARLADIHKGTGVGMSSVAFTLSNCPDDFAKDGKVWKLKK